MWTSLCSLPTGSRLNLLILNLQFLLINRQWLQSALKIELINGSTCTVIWKCEKQRCLNERAAGMFPVFLSRLNKVDNSNGTVLLLLFFGDFLVLTSKFEGNRPCSKRDGTKTFSFGSAVSVWSVFVCVYHLVCNTYGIMSFHLSA